MVEHVFAEVRMDFSSKHFLDGHVLDFLTSFKSLKRLLTLSHALLLRDGQTGVLGFWGFGEIGRASCRERV